MKIFKIILGIFVLCNIIPMLLLLINLIEPSFFKPLTLWEIIVIGYIIIGVGALIVSMFLLLLIFISWCFD